MSDLPKLAMIVGFIYLAGWVGWVTLRLQMRGRSQTSADPLRSATDADLLAEVERRGIG